METTKSHSTGTGSVASSRGRNFDHASAGGSTREPNRSCCGGLGCFRGVTGSSAYAPARAPSRPKRIESKHPTSAPRKVALRFTWPSAPPPPCDRTPKIAPETARETAFLGRALATLDTMTIARPRSRYRYENRPHRETMQPRYGRPRTGAPRSVDVAGGSSWSQRVLWASVLTEDPTIQRRRKGSISQKWRL